LLAQEKEEMQQKNEIGTEIEQSLQSADIFNKLRLRNGQVPIRPLMEGKLE
jgi:hypothetical protein